MYFKGRRVKINFQDNVSCLGKTVHKSKCVNCEHCFGIYDRHVNCKRGEGTTFKMTV